MKFREYRKEDLVSIVKGFKKASVIINMEKPDYIFAPIIGAVPFVDILSIVDKNFRKNSIVYLPNSSRFANRNELMSTWYKNFFEKNDIGEPMKIICLDEVLTGSSAVKGYIQFKLSLQERAKQKAKGMKDELKAESHYLKDLQKRITYKILGLAEKGYVTEHSFNKLVNKKIVHLIRFDNIPTIDNICLNPVRLKKGNPRPNGRITYLPEIERFEVTPSYMDFLRDIAIYVGTDPTKINYQANYEKIREGLAMAIDKH